MNGEHVTEAMEGSSVIDVAALDCRLIVPLFVVEPPTVNKACDASADDTGKRHIRLKQSSRSLRHQS